MPAYNQKSRRFHQQRYDAYSRWNHDAYPHKSESYGTSSWNFNRENRRTFDDVDISKKLAYILRHGASNMHLYMDRSGYVYVEAILNLPQFRNVREDDIIRIVEENDKRRFQLTHDKDNYVMIGATQGHSLKRADQLELSPITDAKDHPCVIHGTTYSAWKNIKDSGLKTMGRTHIHFAGGEPGDGRRVISGIRNYSQVLIYIDLEKALECGIKFFLSKNRVILSGGNEDGVISPDFFADVLDRETRKSLTEDKKIGQKITETKTLTDPDVI